VVGEGGGRGGRKCLILKHLKVIAEREAFCQPALLMGLFLIVFICTGVRSVPTSCLHYLFLLRASPRHSSGNHRSHMVQLLFRHTTAILILLLLALSISDTIGIQEHGHRLLRKGAIKSSQVRRKSSSEKGKSVRNSSTQQST